MIFGTTSFSQTSFSTLPLPTEEKLAAANLLAIALLDASLSEFVRIDGKVWTLICPPTDWTFDACTREWTFKN